MKTVDFSFKIRTRCIAARFPTRSRRRNCAVGIALENETKRAIYKYVPCSMIIKTPECSPKKCSFQQSTILYYFSLIMQYGYVYIQKNTVLVKHKQTEQKYLVLFYEKKKERK